MADVAVVAHSGKNLGGRFDRKTPFELDGGARPATRKLRIKVHPGSVAVCVTAAG